MATIRSIIDLIAMGYSDLPSVVAVIGNAEVNSQTRRLKRKMKEHPDYDHVGYWLNPCEVGTAIYWWITQPFAEAQLQTFLESDGNIAEEYLVSGNFSNNTVRLEGQVKLAADLICDAYSQTKGQPAAGDRLDEENAKTWEKGLGLEVWKSRNQRNVMQVDKNDGKVVLDRGILEVKNHRRIHKKHRNEFATCILAAVKLKFGMPERSRANELAIRRFVAQQMQQRGVREVDAARVTPYIVAAAFIPSDAEIGAAAWLNTRVAKDRLKAWTFGATA